MQLQVLKLEDGDYAKANGGFSLIRAGVKPLKPTAAVANALKLRTLAARLPSKYTPRILMQTDLYSGQKSKPY